jgi:gamma-glutamyltranspeptidase / glutathione hydrolase
VAGDTWRQPELATTLEAIAEQGPSAFYRGPLAERMAAEVARAGGIWQARDLEAYQAIEREPIAFAYRGWEVITMPPPSAGGVVLRQVLGASELFDLASKPWHGVDEVHVYLEATRRAYADRNTLLADPRFVSVPLAQLLDPAYVRARMSAISLEHATPSSEVVAGLPPPVARGSEQTTHFSIIDGAGNAVSNTYTLNTGFGCKLVLPGVGVLLNNEMDDFAAKPGAANVYGLVQAEANAIAPGKRMLSSMTPTILVKDGEVRAVVGTPGGPTISTTVVQIIRALVDYGRPLDEAVAAPRLHHQWLPDQVFAEEAVSAELVTALEARGHQVKRRPPIGHANCVEVDPASRGFRAVADTARDGGKAGAI